MGKTYYQLDLDDRIELCRIHEDGNALSDYQDRADNMSFQSQLQLIPALHLVCEFSINITDDS